MARFVRLTWKFNDDVIDTEIVDTENAGCKDLVETYIRNMKNSLHPRASLIVEELQLVSTTIIRPDAPDMSYEGS